MYQRALQGYDSCEMAQCGLNHTLPPSAAIKTYEKGRAGKSKDIPTLLLGIVSANITAGARDSGGRGWEFDIMAMQGREFSIWYGKCYVMLVRLETAYYVY